MTGLDDRVIDALFRWCAAMVFLLAFVAVTIRLNWIDWDRKEEP